MIHVLIFSSFFPVGTVIHKNCKKKVGAQKNMAIYIYILVVLFFNPLPLSEASILFFLALMTGLKWRYAL